MPGDARGAARPAPRRRHPPAQAAAPTFQTAAKGGDHAETTPPLGMPHNLYSPGSRSRPTGSVRHRRSIHHQLTPPSSESTIGRCSVGGGACRRRPRRPHCLRRSPPCRRCVTQTESGVRCPPVPGGPIQTGSCQLKLIWAESQCDSGRLRQTHRLTRPSSGDGSWLGAATPTDVLICGIMFSGPET